MKQMFGLAYASSPYMYCMNFAKCAFNQ